MPLGRTAFIVLLSVLCLLAVQLVAAGNATADGACGPLNGFGVCGKASHCCSRYGYCGNGGSYCAQGCNPLYSYNIESCYPLPACQSQTYTFGSGGTARLVSKDQYNKVNPGLVDFIIDTGEIRQTAEGVVLTLKDDKVGTKITATRAMRYGKVTFEMQTAWSGGVVTAAVLMGDTTEEVDVEFVGNSLKSFQSNVFFDYVASSESHKLSSDTSTSFANYSIAWTEDQLQWGYSKQSTEQIMRTVTSANKHIPVLPMYMQVSIWPGGESAATGTKNWAGGAIDWSGQRFLEHNRTFEVVIKSITVECGETHEADQAYRYIKDKQSGQVGFEMVKLKGYGVGNQGDKQKVLAPPQAGAAEGAPASTGGSDGQSSSLASDTASGQAGASPASSSSGSSSDLEASKVAQSGKTSKTAFSTSFSTQIRVSQSSGGGKAGGAGPDFVKDPIMTLPTAPLPSELQAMVSGLAS